MRGPHGEDLPGAILFACTMNSVRSPMAAAIMRHLFGQFVYVHSAGARAGELDPLAVEVMEEIGIEIGKYKPKRFEDLEDSSFDLIVTLSPEAQHKAMELTRTSAVEVEYWPTMDPTPSKARATSGSTPIVRVRDELMRRIEARFAVERAGDALRPPFLLASGGGILPPAKPAIAGNRLPLLFGGFGAFSRPAKKTQRTNGKRRTS